MPEVDAEAEVAARGDDYFIKMLLDASYVYNIAKNTDYRELYRWCGFYLGINFTCSCGRQGRTNDAIYRNAIKVRRIVFSPLLVTVNI